MIWYLSCAFFAILTFVYLLFLFRIKSGIRAVKTEAAAVDKDELNNSLFISVIIPARNEAQRIAHCIHSLQAQSYPAAQTQFIIIDDHSDDDTIAVARQAIGEDDRFVILDLDESDNSAEGKKEAVTAGVHHARGEAIVTTDADCTHHNGWLASISRSFHRDADVIAGPVVLYPANTLFERLQQLEFMGLIGVGMGFFGIGYPRLCNGANFAYRKSAFFAVGGFGNKSALASGDDEFLLHTLVYKEKRSFAFNASPEALVRTPPQTSLRHFISQRIRWASKGLRYDDARFTAFLMLLFVYFFFCAAAPFTVFVSVPAFVISSLFLLIKAYSEFAVLRATAAQGERISLTDFSIAEILHPYYLVFVSLVGTFMPVQWKNRRIKT